MSKTLMNSESINNPTISRKVLQWRTLWLCFSCRVMYKSWHHNLVWEETLTEGVMHLSNDLFVQPERYATAYGNDPEAAWSDVNICHCNNYQQPITFRWQSFYHATRMKKGTSSTPKIYLLLSLWIETVLPPVKTCIEEFRESYKYSYTVDIEEFLGDNCSIMLPEGPVLDIVNLDISLPACILLQYF